MSNEKPVELTDTERAALMHHIGGWKFERQGLANAEDAFVTEVSRIIADREAAARREALLEAAEDLEPLVANQHPTASLNPEVWLRDRAFEMDEPECDEEGGE